MEVSSILTGSFFIIVGVLLCRWIVITRLQLEKEVKEGRSIALHNFLPYWNADDFTEKGNALRKTYNMVYYALLVYSLALYLYMQAND
jgi:hypothetical protein